MKMMSKGQVTLPPGLRKKHGLRPRGEVDSVDKPDGVFEVHAGKLWLAGLRKAG